MLVKKKLIYWCIYSAIYVDIYHQTCLSLQKATTLEDLVKIELTIVLINPYCTAKYPALLNDQVVELLPI